MKLDDLTKFLDDYFEILSGYSAFVQHPHFVQPPPENNTLFNNHDSFALNLKKLVKKYQYNLNYPKTQQIMFLHMINHVATDYFVVAKKNIGRFVDLEPLAGLDVAMT